MGVFNLREIFNEKYYEDLEGGILESFGRLFRNAVKLYVYPMRQDAYGYYSSRSDGAAYQPNPSFPSNVLITAGNLQVEDRLAGLYAHLYENRCIESIVGFDADTLDVFSRDVLKKIREEDPAWEKMVPPHVAAAIKRRGLFGYEAIATPPACRLSEVSQ